MAAPTLSGYRIVDLTVEHGELCARLLADLGAEVIKVESAGGSPARSIAPSHEGVGLFWAYRNAGKKSVVLDPGDDRLHELLACSDAVVLSYPNASVSAEELADRHPHLVVTSISPYGLHAAWTDRIATEGVLAATSTTAFKAGVPEKDPLLPPASFVDDSTSVTFAFATLCALWQRDTAEQPGWGQLLDCSINEEMANQGDWTLANNSARMIAAGESFDEIRSGAGPVWPSFPCVDGFVRVVMLAPRQWRAMRAWLGEPDYLQDPELDSFIARLGLSETVINPLISELFADKTMDEISTEAQSRGIVCTPLAQVADVLANAHFAERGTFVELDLGGGVVGRVPSGFLEVDGVRAGPTVGPPEPGQHTDEVFANLGTPRAAPAGAAGEEQGLPLAGLRVADFGHGGVGPEAGRMLAQFGADVIKVESRTYPDFMRVQAGSEMSPSFASSGRSKRAFGANAKTPEGREVLKQLVAQSQIVIENNSVGVMDQLGLGFVHLSAVNPGIVMLSSQLMGSRGPWSSFRGYGPSTRAAGGIEMLWNYDDQEEPAGGMSIFPDHLAGRVGVLGIMAGLLAGRQSDDGASLIELAQVETTVGITGDLLIKEALEPGSVAASGNRRLRGAPWGLFRCANATDDRKAPTEQWAAITCRDDTDWDALVGAMGSPDWATDPALATAAGRHDAADAVEAGVRAWTAELGREEVVVACQAAGVPAGEMLTSLETLHNPQFVSQDFATEVEQPGGFTPTVFLEGPGVHGSRMGTLRTTVAPIMGEHTREICRDLLGMAEADTEALIAAQVLEVTPPVEPPS